MSELVGSDGQRKNCWVCCLDRNGLSERGHNILYVHKYKKHRFIFRWTISLVYLPKNTTAFMAIIGRKKKIEEFRHLYDSVKAEFVAIYGQLRN